jgi:hypothetical protein
MARSPRFRRMSAWPHGRTAAWPHGCWSSRCHRRGKPSATKRRRVAWNLQRCEICADCGRRLEEAMLTRDDDSMMLKCMCAPCSKFIMLTLCAPCSKFTMLTLRHAHLAPCSPSCRPHQSVDRPARTPGFAARVLPLSNGRPIVWSRVPRVCRSFKVCVCVSEAHQTHSQTPVRLLCSRTGREAGSIPCAVPARAQQNKFAPWAHHTMYECNYRCNYRLHPLVTHTLCRDGLLEFSDRKVGSVLFDLLLLLY